MTRIDTIQASQCIQKCFSLQITWKGLFPHEFQVHRAVLFAVVCVLCVRPQNSITQSLYQDHPSPPPASAQGTSCITASSFPSELSASVYFLFLLS